MPLASWGAIVFKLLVNERHHVLTVNYFDATGIVAKLLMIEIRCKKKLFDKLLSDVAKVIDIDG